MLSSLLPELFHATIHDLLLMWNRMTNWWQPSPPSSQKLITSSRFGASHFGVIAMYQLAGDIKYRNINTTELHFQSLQSRFSEKHSKFSHQSSYSPSHSSYTGSHHLPCRFNGLLVCVYLSEDYSERYPVRVINQSCWQHPEDEVCIAECISTWMDAMS